MKLSQLIKIASDAYPDDLIGRYHKAPKRDFGDTLAQFLARELKDTFDPDASDEEQLREGVRALTSSIRELSGVRDALLEHLPEIVEPVGPGN